MNQPSLDLMAFLEQHIWLREQHTTLQSSWIPGHPCVQKDVVQTLAAFTNPYTNPYGWKKHFSEKCFFQSLGRNNSFPLLARPLLADHTFPASDSSALPLEDTVWIGLGNQARDGLVLLPSLSVNGFLAYPLPTYWNNRRTGRRVQTQENRKGARR